MLCDLDMYVHCTHVHGDGVRAGWMFLSDLIPINCFCVLRLAGLV